MEIYLIKTGFGLRGWTPEDEDKIRKIKANDVVKCELTKPRNVLFHRKFFALLQLTFENQTKYSNLEDLLIEVKLKVGHYQEYITASGQIVYIPKSISFGAMDEYEFSEFFNKALSVCAKIINVSNETIERQILSFY